MVERLGTPSEESHVGSFTYLIYDNGCAAKCGMDDVVVLENGHRHGCRFPLRASGRFTGVKLITAGAATVRAGHFAPAPIRASTPDDSAHRGGIVFAPAAADCSPAVDTSASFPTTPIAHAPQPSAGRSDDSEPIQRQTPHDVSHRRPARRSPDPAIRRSLRRSSPSMA